MENNKLLCVENLKKFYGDIKAVDGIDFYTDKGESIGLLGPNGAGKTTAVSIIATLIKPDSGNIFYKGEDIVKNPSSIRKELGYVPQDIALYPELTGLVNLRFWGRLYGLKGKELEDSILRVSTITGITERLSSAVKTYSGGMKRRLNIGAALLHSPKLLILDEPTVGIDPQSRNHILETVKNLKKEGMSIIYISHYMEEVESVCKRIYIMDHGKIIASGSKEELLKEADTYMSVKLICRKNINLMSDELKKNNNIQSVLVNNNEIVIILNTESEIFDYVNKAALTTDCTIKSYQLLEPSLETVFLALTGRALRD